MAISSSSGSNSFGDSSSSSSSPYSSPLPASSVDSIPESREPTPGWDPTAAYEALAPLHWDAEEFDFGVVSEEDEPTTKGEEDFQFLFQEELEKSEDDGFSWEGADFSSEEEIDSSSDDDEPMGGKPFRFLGSSEEDSEEEKSGGGDGWSDFGSEGGSSAFCSDDDDDDDSGDAPARSPKCRRY